MKPISSLRPERSTYPALLNGLSSAELVDLPNVVRPALEAYGQLPPASESLFCVLQTWLRRRELEP